MISKGFLKSSIVYSVVGALPYASGFLLLPWFTAYLTPAQFGINAMYIALMYLGQVISSFGMDMSAGVLYFDYRDDREKLKSFLGTVFLTISMLGALTFTVFLLGGLTGPPAGTVSTDLHLHDTYFIVGHFHNTMFGGFIFPIFAAVYYWYPKITGRKLNETLGKIHFYLMTPSFLLMTFGQMRIGLLGMRRRIADYDPALNFDFTNLLITIGGFLIAIAVLIFFINLFISARKGEVADGNIWKSRSPEWTILPSPAPEHNYKGMNFEVVGNPYDYGLKGSKFVQQTEPGIVSDEGI